MEIKGEEKELVEIAILLKKARIKAQELHCNSDKQRIVEGITLVENNVNDLIATF